MHSAGTDRGERTMGLITAFTNETYSAGLGMGEGGGRAPKHM